MTYSGQVAYPGMLKVAFIGIKLGVRIQNGFTNARMHLSNFPQIYNQQTGVLLSYGDQWKEVAH